MNAKIAQSDIEEFLIYKDDGNLFHRESQFLEFKESFNLAGLAEYLRDFAAFSNNRGGYIIFGVKDKPKRELVGLSAKAKDHFDKLDPEKISGHLIEHFSGHVEWCHEVFKISEMHFGVFHVFEASSKPIICKKDDGKDQSLRNGDIYFRYGGRTQRIQHSELEAIINARIEQNNRQWLDLVSKIGKAGPQNAAILDTEKGLIEKDDSKILVIDQELIKGIQWIREGEFSEVSGERTLKLVGAVQPIEHVEVVRKVKENKLKDYPLTATEMVKGVKGLHPQIKQNDIYEIISTNKIKDNKEYSAHIFRNRKQEEDYERTGNLPKGITSIYKSAVIDLIVQIYKNDYEQ